MEDTNATNKAEENSGQRKWSTLTLTVVSVITATIGIIAGSLGIFDWLTKPADPAFSVAVANDEFTLPTNQALTKLGIEPESIAELKPIEGVLKINLKNTGDLDANDVNIDANDSGYALWSFDDGRSVFEEFEKRFKIGTMKSNQTVNVVIWGKANSFFQGSNPYILHEMGTQEIVQGETGKIVLRGFLVFSILLYAVIMYRWTTWQHFALHRRIRQLEDHLVHWQVQAALLEQGRYEDIEEKMRQFLRERK